MHTHDQRCLPSPRSGKAVLVCPVVGRHLQIEDLRHTVKLGQAATKSSRQRWICHLDLGLPSNEWLHSCSGSVAAAAGRVGVGVGVGEGGVGVEVVVVVVVVAAAAAVAVAVAVAVVAVVVVVVAAVGGR